MLSCVAFPRCVLRLQLACVDHAQLSASESRDACNVACVSAGFCDPIFETIFRSQKKGPPKSNATVGHSLAAPVFDPRKQSLFLTRFLVPGCAHLCFIASTFPLHGWLGGRAASAFATRAPVSFGAERSAAPAVGDSCRSSWPAAPAVLPWLRGFGQRCLRGRSHGLRCHGTDVRAA